MRIYKIILVENDEDEQMFMRDGFLSSGLFEILDQASSGEDLIEWLTAHPGQLPDVVLSDLNMPGMNGMDILQALKSDERYRHIPIIITSTSSTPSIIRKCLEAGAVDYVVKPETFVQYAPFVSNLHKIISDKNLVS
jgi:CheY-like chemotaxis protein